MVKSLVDILDRNCDPNLPVNTPALRNYLYRHADTLTFDQALRELESYSLDYNQGHIPAKLECIDRAGGIYSIANRLTLQTDSPETGRSIQLQNISQGKINEREFQTPAGQSLPSKLMNSKASQNDLVVRKRIREDRVPKEPAEGQFQQIPLI